MRPQTATNNVTTTAIARRRIIRVRRRRWRSLARASRVAASTSRGERGGRSFGRISWARSSVGASRSSSCVGVMSASSRIGEQVVARGSALVLGDS